MWLSMFCSVLKGIEGKQGQYAQQLQMLLASLYHLANRVGNASTAKISCGFDGGLLQLPVLQQRRDQITHVRSQPQQRWRSDFLPRQTVPDPPP